MNIYADKGTGNQVCKLHTFADSCTVTNLWTIKSANYLHSWAEQLLRA